VAEAAQAPLVAANWVLTAAHCFLGPTSRPDGSGTAGISTLDELAAKNARGPDFGKYASIKPSYLFAGDQVSIKFQAYDRSQTYTIVSVVTHPLYKPSEFDIPENGKSAGPLHDVALVKFEPDDWIAGKLSKDNAKPASIPATSYAGGVTLLGYGVAEDAPGGSVRANLTWPEADVVPQDGRLLIKKATIRTFCSGDSGGPAFAGFQRGCPAPPEDNPLELVGVISYHDPVKDAGNQNPVKVCQISPVSGFTDLGSPDVKAFLCGVTSDAIAGCR
jgi:Trypsin